MPVDFTTHDDAPPLENEGSMFAPTPIWDRDAKKRRKGRAARPAASRTVRDPALDAGEAGVMGAAEPADATYETQPARRVEAHRRGIPTGAVAAGVFAVAVIAGVGWYATSRPHDSGIALTLGAPASSEMATSEIALNAAAPPTEAAPPATPATAPQTTATTQEATTTTTVRAATPAATHKKTTTTVARTSTSRVRPAQASSAAESGTDTATTAPMVSTPATSPNPVLSVPAAPVTMAPSVSTPAPAAPAADPTVTP
jgi:hypothetical protein